MPKFKQISFEKRAHIIALHKEGLSQVKIAEKVKCSRNGVQTTIKRYKETSSMHNRPGQGRKRCTTTREDRYIKKISLRNRRKTASEVAAEFREASNKKISNRTVRTRLVEAGLKGCKARKKPYLSEINRKKRILWAKEHQNWTDEDWAKVVWSDESNFEVSSAVDLFMIYNDLIVKY